MAFSSIHLAKFYKVKFNSMVKPLLILYNDNVDNNNNNNRIKWKKWKKKQKTSLICVLSIFPTLQRRITTLGKSIQFQVYKNHFTWQIYLIFIHKNSTCSLWFVFFPSVDRTLTFSKKIALRPYSIRLIDKVTLVTLFSFVAYNLNVSRLYKHFLICFTSVYMIFNERNDYYHQFGMKLMMEWKQRYMYAHHQLTNFTNGMKIK